MATSAIIDDAARIREIAGAARRVAVLGCRSERHADRPAFFVPSYLADRGITIIPVVCVSQDVGTTILGETACARVSDVPGGPVDVLCVFR
jgi:predicted CoA-binding protein